MRGVRYSRLGRSFGGEIRLLLCEDCGDIIGTLCVERVLDEDGNIKIDKNGELKIYLQLTILDEDIFNNVNYLDGDINGDFIVNCKCGCNIEMKRYKTGGGLEIVKNGKIEFLTK